MSHERLQEIDERSRHLTGLGVIQPPVFLHRFSCIDGRCRWAAYRGDGHRPLACKQHPLPGAHVSHRNERQVISRLTYDVQRARGRMGLHTLVLYESHSDCAYRALCGNMSQQRGWEIFQGHLRAVPDTTLAWVSRDVATGSIKIVGNHGSVDAAQLHHVNLEELIARLQAIGYPDPKVAATLAACLAGNVAYQQTMPHSPEHREEGVVIGARIPGHGNFQVDNRIVADGLDESLEVVANLLAQRQLKGRPFIFAAIARHPRKYHGHYLSPTRVLTDDVKAALQRIGHARSFQLYAGTVCKGDGHLRWQEVS